MSLATATPARVEFDAGVDELLEDAPDYEQSPWYCVRTDSFPCPAEGCDFVALFMTAAHLIIVWESNDDPRLLWHAELARRVGRNPRVEEWRREFGQCIAFDYWVSINRPIHGRLSGRPDGFPAGDAPAWG